MSQYVFEKLAPEYERLASIATVKPSREAELRQVCKTTLLPNKAIYRRVEQLTHVPAAGLMALAMREMSGSIHKYLGNGQRLTMRTTIVPKGRGPFPDTPDGFVAGCLDALAIDKLDQVWKSASGWSRARFCYESEEWNGWGYRARGIPSPYVFGATTVQKAGKFVADHVYSATTMDVQLGTLAIVEQLVAMDPDLAFFETIRKVESPPIIPSAAPHPIMGAVNIKWVQTSLNKLKIYEHGPLRVDGDVGRETRGAVRMFEERYHLSLDRGIPGPQVVAKLKEQLALAGLE